MTLRNFTCNLRMFLDSVELWIENKTKKLGKTVEKRWSQSCRKMALYVQQVALKKSALFIFYVLFVFTFWHFFFKVTLLTNMSMLPHIWDQIFKTVFSKHFLLFFTQSSKQSRNMHKLRVQGLWTLSFLPSKLDYWENGSFISAQDFVKVV